MTKKKITQLESAIIEQFCTLWIGEKIRVPYTPETLKKILLHWKKKLRIQDLPDSNVHINKTFAIQIVWLVNKPIEVFVVRAT